MKIKVIEFLDQIFIRCDISIYVYDNCRYIINNIDESYLDIMSDDTFYNTEYGTFIMEWEDKSMGNIFSLEIGSHGASYFSEINSITHELNDLILDESLISSTNKINTALKNYFEKIN